MDSKNDNDAVEYGRQLLMAAFDSHPAAWFLIDHNRCVRAFNDSAESIAASVGLTLSPSLPTEELRCLDVIGSDFEDHLSRALMGETIRREIQVEQITTDLYRWYELTHTPVRNAKGRVSGVSFSALEISERKDTEQREHHRQRLESLGRMAGGVAHDFNNILTAILVNTSVLLDEATDDFFLEALGEIEDAARMSRSMVKHLMTFARRAETSPKRFDLNGRVRQALSLAEKSLGPDVSLMLELSDQQLPVLLDPVQLEQVVVNMVINARDALHERGEVVVGTGWVDIGDHWADRLGLQAGKYVYLDVVDNGIGMAPEVIERVFEPFFTTKGSNGSGFGLATCYGIIKRASGSIDVTSEPGEGTAFRVYLPPAPMFL